MLAGSVCFFLYAQEAGVAFDEGNRAYKAGNYTEAFELFSRAVESEPENARYQYNLGLAARKLNLYGESAAALNKAKKLDPSISFTNNPRDFEDKLTEMTKLSDGVEDTGGLADTFAEGEKAYKGGDYAKAFDLFKRAVESNPGVAKYQYNLGLAARKLKKYDIALASFLEAKRLDPDIGFTNDKQGFSDKLKEAETETGAVAGTGEAAGNQGTGSEASEAITDESLPVKKIPKISSKNLRTVLMLTGAAIFITIIRLTSKKRRGGGKSTGGKYTGNDRQDSSRSDGGDYHDYDRYSSSGSHSSGSSSFDHS